MGMDIGWIAKSAQIVATGKDDAMTITIGSYLSIFNGKNVMLSYKPFIKNGVSYIPARNVYSIFGYSYTFDSKLGKLNCEKNLTSTYKEMLIAHGGGEYNGRTISNSIEALETSYERGYRLIEIDFSLTTDGRYVLLHDWKTVEMLSPVKNRDLSYDEFMAVPMYEDMHQLDADMFLKWMMDHPDVQVVTDTKGDNAKLLQDLGEIYEPVIDRIIPQIYYMDEYAIANQVGFKKVIYTLYKTKNTQAEILNFAKQNKLFAVTLPKENVATALVPKLNGIGISVYSHTIYTPEEAKKNMEAGVKGLYVDKIIEAEIR